MLARSGLCDDALLAEPLCEQDLAQRVVDLVRARVGEVFTLDVDLRPAELCSEVTGEVDWGRATNVVCEESVQLVPERLVAPRRLVCLLQFVERGHECFWHELATEAAKAARCVWL